MNRKLKNYLVIIVVLLVAVTGGSMLYEKGLRDRERQVMEELYRKQRAEERKLKINALRDSIPHKQAEIQMAINELQNVNDYHFLRTEDEKKNQLASQNKIINDLKQDLNNLSRELQALESYTDY